MPREERERRYIADYLSTFFSSTGYILNVELGPIPEEIVARYGLYRGARLFHPTRPRVDAVIPTDTTYWLVEAKIREPHTGIGALLNYLGLAKNTPDLPGYTGQLLALRLVVPWVLDWVRASAQEANIDLVKFLPPWVEDYVRERQNYFTRDYRLAREERMRLRRSLGLE